jgi:hypothetical protein
VSSIFATPLGHVAMSNGAAEEILRFCEAEARRVAELASGPAERDAARAVSELFEHRLLIGAGGMYGFDVTSEPPLERTEARRVLLRCFAELARAVHAETPPWTFITTQPLRAYWISIVRRLHDGVASSIPGSSPIALDLSPALEHACAAYPLLVERQRLRSARRHDQPDADPPRELRVTCAARDHVRAAGNAFSDSLVSELEADLAELERG